MVKTYVRGLFGQRAVPSFEPTKLVPTHEAGLAHEVR